MSHDQHSEDGPGPWVGLVADGGDADATAALDGGTDAELEGTQDELVDADGAEAGALEMARLHARAVDEADGEGLDDEDLDALLAEVPEDYEDEASLGLGPVADGAGQGDGRNGYGAFDLEDLAAVLEENDPPRGATGAVDATPASEDALAEPTDEVLPPPVATPDDEALPGEPSVSVLDVGAPTGDADARTDVSDAALEDAVEDALAGLDVAGEDATSADEPVAPVASTDTPGDDDAQTVAMDDDAGSDPAWSVDADIVDATVSDEDASIAEAVDHAASSWEDDEWLRAGAVALDVGEHDEQVGDEPWEVSTSAWDEADEVTGEPEDAGHARAEVDADEADTYVDDTEAHVDTTDAHVASLPPPVADDVDRAPEPATEALLEALDDTDDRAPALAGAALGGASDVGGDAHAPTLDADAYDAAEAPVDLASFTARGSARRTGLLGRLLG